MADEEIGSPLASRLAEVEQTDRLLGREMEVLAASVSGLKEEAVRLSGMSLEEMHREATIKADTEQKQVKWHRERRACRLYGAREHTNGVYTVVLPGTREADRLPPLLRKKMQSSMAPEGSAPRKQRKADGCCAARPKAVDDDEHGGKRFVYSLQSKDGAGFNQVSYIFFDEFNKVWVIMVNKMMNGDVFLYTNSQPCNLVPPESNWRIVSDNFGQLPRILVAGYMAATLPELVLPIGDEVAKMLGVTYNLVDEGVPPDAVMGCCSARPHARALPYPRRDTVGDDAADAREPPTRQTIDGETVYQPYNTHGASQLEGFCSHCLMSTLHKLKKHNTYSRCVCESKLG
jgi:hypothetical protein